MIHSSSPKIRRLAITGSRPILGSASMRRRASWPGRDRAAPWSQGRDTRSGFKEPRQATWWRSWIKDARSVAITAFSQDPEQRFLYVASRSPARVWVLDRKTLEPLDSFGRPGIAPGEFYVLHHMNVDTKGNLYVTEVQDGKRAQKFVFKGLSTTAN